MIQADRALRYRQPNPPFLVIRVPAGTTRNDQERRNLLDRVARQIPYKGDCVLDLVLMEGNELVGPQELCDHLTPELPLPANVWHPFQIE